MEGSSPSLIWERWTLPMYYTQCRVWADHPTTEEMVAAYFKVGKRPKQRGAGGRDIDVMPVDLKAALDKATAGQEA
ncbi:MAG: hypothetical protein JWO51_144 [Rhodospirillales bacterium]|nr:hypothetical protein [Rhodospirillales bacterium]